MITFLLVAVLLVAGVVLLLTARRARTIRFDRLRRTDPELANRLERQRAEHLSQTHAATRPGPDGSF